MRHLVLTTVLLLLAITVPFIIWGAEFDASKPGRTRAWTQKFG